MVVWKNPILRSVFLGSLGLFLLSLLWAFIKFGKGGGKLIVHYDVLKSVNLWGISRDVFGIVVFGLTLGLMNFFLSEAVFFRERILSYIFALSTLFLSLIIFISIAVIISVN